MRKFVKSISYAFVAQVVSLMVSVFMSFFVSKYMTIESYGYYQLFLFYSTYVGIFQFGTSEGTYLENGGKLYSELDFQKLKELFLSVLSIVVFVLLILLCGIQFFESNKSKKEVLIIIALYAIVHFFVVFFGMLKQAVNETENEYLEYDGEVRP